MSEYEAFDLPSYIKRVQSSPCFICKILSGEDRQHHIIYKDEVAFAFFNKYPTLYGYTLIAPVEHREEVTSDFSLDGYLRLQKIVYLVAEALRQELPTERIYILSLGSRQGNSHVHWHVAPLPPGLPYEQQQFEALMLTNRGYLRIPSEELESLAARLAGRIASAKETRP